MKKIISVVLSVLLVLSTAYMSPAYAESSDSAIQTKIDELWSMFGGSYFTVDRSTGCGKKSSGHACNNCYTPNIVATTWFKNLFGNVSAYQFPYTYYNNGEQHGRPGWSCFGFASFAEWYIFKSSNSATVDTYHAGTYSFNYSNIAAYAKKGDLIRLHNGGSGGHSVIMIGANTTGIQVIHSNWTGTYNCAVRQDTVKYDGSNYDYAYFTISRAKNRNVLDTQPPTTSTLSINKSLFKTGENISFSAYGEGATGYTIGIDRNGVRVYTSDIGTSFNISFNEPGDYSAYVSSWNSTGLLDSERIYFGVSGAMDLGTDFFAYIINTALWLPIEVKSDKNVVLSEWETGMQNQLWRFTRMWDGSYKITSLLDGKVLDVYGAENANQTNIQTEIFTDNPAQYWEIFGTSGNYKLKAKCTDYVMDIYGGNLPEYQNNIQTFTYHNGANQNFQIYKVSETFALGKSQNIGENFIAKIINSSSKLALATDNNRNIILKNDSKDINQYWKFVLLDNGTYKIESLLDGNALDVEYGSSSIEANVKTNLFLNHEAQFWEVYGKEGNYKLKAKCTDYVLDVGGGSLSLGARLQTYIYNDTAAQKFSIEKIIPYTKSTITKSGTKLTVDTAVYNIIEPYDILITGYKGNNFVAVKRVPYNAQNSPYTLEGDIDKIKVMVWSSSGTLEPLCDAEEIPSSKWITK